MRALDALEGHLKMLHKYDLLNANVKYMLQEYHLEAYDLLLNFQSRKELNTRYKADLKVRLEEIIENI